MSSGAGWACDSSAVDPPVIAFVARCIHHDPDLLLMAKRYEVPPAEVTTPQVLVEQVYPKVYRRMFDEVDVHEPLPAHLRSREALDVTADGTRSGRPLRLRERVAVQGTHVYILTEMGSPDAFETFGDVRAKWFGETKFRGLE